MTQERARAIYENLREVRQRIAEAALRAGRASEDVTLVAVTKTFPADVIVAAWEAGQRHFGENRPEEGARKIPEVMRELTVHQMTLLTDDPATESDVNAPRASGEAKSDIPVWHMIGHIQSRKTETVATTFDFVHSVDRYKIARRLSVLGENAGREIPVLLECNISGEESKYGYDVAGWEDDDAVRTAFLDEVQRILPLPGLQVVGLMTVAPFVDDSESVRPVFVSLRALRDYLREHASEVDWHHLSMGMTSDFEVAVEEGATLVRIGRAIFGARQ